MTSASQNFRLPLEVTAPLKLENVKKIRENTYRDE